MITTKNFINGAINGAAGAIIYNGYCGYVAFCTKAMHAGKRFRNRWLKKRCGQKCLIFVVGQCHSASSKSQHFTQRRGRSYKMWFWLCGELWSVSPVADRLKAPTKHSPPLSQSLLFYDSFERFLTEVSPAHRKIPLPWGARSQSNEGRSTVEIYSMATHAKSQSSLYVTSVSTGEQARRETIFTLGKEQRWWQSRCSCN